MNTPQIDVPKNGYTPEICEVDSPRATEQEPPPPPVAFNVYDWKGEKVAPPLVQKLTDRHNISLTWGFVRNVWFSDKYEADRNAVLEHRSAAFAVDGGDGIGAVEVHRAQPEDSGGVDDDSNLHPASAATIAIVHFAVTVHHSFGISSAVACEELLRPFFV
ncbi:hypothetical protein GUJ93_ZPchr1061g2836 [Zizania palustris]|uniref:Uncharacterized protein n=1 Tax=Zizania palustris TaxID=103762 RepID=A0A8J5URL1_ZIZPA|nr:hypothetical protein GUJ93_ZPchr1061g2836 [Zizania palustris]